MIEQSNVRQMRVDKTGLIFFTTARRTRGPSEGFRISYMVPSGLVDSVSTYDGLHEYRVK